MPTENEDDLMQDRGSPIAGEPHAKAWCSQNPDHGIWCDL